MVYQYLIELKSGELGELSVEANILDSKIGLDKELCLRLEYKAGFISIYSSQIKQITRLDSYLDTLEIQKEMMAFLLFRERFAHGKHKDNPYIMKYIKVNRSTKPFRDYWRDEMGENKSYYRKVLEKYLGEYYGEEHTPD